MTELLTAAQMRAIEAAAIASGEVTGLELMERAGRGVVEAIWEEWPELKAGSFRAVVLCGPGNNGGDGFVVARLLKEWGWEVEVFLYGEPGRMPPDAKANYERWLGMGEVGALAALNDLSEERPCQWFDVVVDAFFGTGLRRSLPDEVARTLVNLFRSYMAGRVVSVDVPSGLCSDSGRPLVPVQYGSKSWPALDGLIVEASLTVTFHRRKSGHALGVGPRYCGRVILKAIGLTGARFDPAAGFPAGDMEPPATGRLSKGAGHKYSHGHALILSGTTGKGGAARLAARGALRIGAGLVTVGCPPEAVTENAARLDAVMLRAVADAEALAGELEDSRINALCLGPGLGLDERARGLLVVALESRSKPRPTGPVGRGLPRLVLDADALTLLSQNPDLFAALHQDCVLTPHAGEFARLFPDIAEKLAAPATKGPAYSKVDATREAAKRAGCVVLYKGPDTVIADPSGRCAINSAHYDRAAPWLATAGSGDVLAGFITGLLARNFAPMQAAETAAWLHVECARKFGPGLIAEDLPEQLPAVFRDLGL
ncbi:MAG TPA: NAD(P)H-hydrate dehydratase [Albidovulum sp.]|uniref:NAD(P)H-hydrate dehydratase n=1 Tax=Albidovulum sp. TaxID=1872424 RepID=UPI002B619FA4|nr:NAD(P)H-hydrate dehydratase [Albidovulum sp.]